MTGKFNGDALAEALYELECDEIDGDVEAPTGWFGIIRTDDAVRAAIGDLFLDLDTGADEAVPAAFLVTEDNYGFFDAASYATVEEAEAVYARLVEEYAAWATSEEGDEASIVAPRA